MKAKSITITLLFAMLIISCSQDSEQLDSFTEEINRISLQYEEQLAVNRTEVRRADSLQTQVHNLEQELQKALGEAPTYNASDADEEAIESLVAQLHQGWAKMFETDDKKDLLKHFLPKYTASALRINTENIPSVRRKNDSNFEEFLDQLIAANNIALSFGETKFLYTEVRGDVFVTSYRTRLRVYEGNEQRYTSSLVTQLAGERKDGEWKVGHYNWVTFNY
jgi:ketosteroid isomerase-like protein